MAEEELKLPLMCDEQAINDTSEPSAHDCKHCGAVGGGPHNCFGLKPMSIAPRRAILAIHYEKGLMEITPDHEANWWLAYARPGVGHWYEIENEEGGLMDDGEFNGWAFECG